MTSVLQIGLLGGRRLRIALVVGCLGAFVTAGGSAWAARTSPPKVPACYAQTGECEGIFLKSPIGAVKQTGAAHGIFTLRGPAPLQFTTAVSCGDLGCLYNHLNWAVGGGARVLGGCDVNESECKVKIASGSSRWVPVLVNQNDFPKALFLLWTSGGRPRLAGRVMSRSCSATSCSRRPAAGVAVVARRQAGGTTGRARTGRDGRYAMRLKAGVYDVSLVGAKGAPREQRANLGGDVTGVDFTICAASSRAHAALIGFHCTVDVDVDAVDRAGNHLRNVTFLASNHFLDSFSNIFELPSSAVATSPGRMTLPDEVWQVESVPKLAAINPDGTDFSRSPPGYGFTGARCEGPSGSLGIYGDATDHACRWDFTDQALKLEPYRIVIDAQVSPVDVSLAAGLGTSVVRLRNNGLPAILTRDGSGAPRSRLRFEVPLERTPSASDIWFVSARAPGKAHATIKACSGTVQDTPGLGQECVFSLDTTPHASVTFGR